MGLSDVPADAGNRWLAEGGGRSRTYDERWQALAAAGQAVHGEADLVEGLGPSGPLSGRQGPSGPLSGDQGTSGPLSGRQGPSGPPSGRQGPSGPLSGRQGPRSVLDAGCGTGRVAIELARRGMDLVGVDVDPSMLDVARGKAPGLAWILGDLATVDLGRTFDVVVLAGNVMIFLGPGTEAAVVGNLARHVSPGGALVAGFSLEPGRLDLAAYDRHAAAAGLIPEARWSTWAREPFSGGNYAVSVHRRAGQAVA